MWSAGGPARTGAAVAAVAVAVALGVPLAAAGGQSISVASSSTPTIRVSEAVAGSPPTAVVQSAGSYTVNNNNQIRKIQAQLSAAPPAGVTIEVNLTTASGATSLGWVALSTTYRDVVTGYPRNTSGTYDISYRVTATSAAGVLAARSLTVTLRIL